MKYYIAWKAVITDATGCGTKTFSKIETEKIVAQANKDWKGIVTHWIVSTTQ